MKTIAFAAALAAVASQAPPALAADAYDAVTMGMGGTFAARSADVNSPYWNPAFLTSARGTFFLGADTGFLLGNNAIAVGDLWGAIQPTPSGAYGSFINDLIKMQNYQAGIQKALAENLDPADPPTLTLPAFPDELRGYFRSDVGLLGVNIPWGGNKASKKTTFDAVASKDIVVDIPERPNDHSFSFRSYARVPGVDLGISAPTLLSAINVINEKDADIAKRLIALNKDVQSGSVDISKLKGDVDLIRKDLRAGLTPLMDSEGKSVIISINEGAYLTNALSYQMPLSDVPVVRDWLASQSVFVGATARIHTSPSLVAPGFDPVGSALPGVKAGLPGRLELVNTFKIKEPYGKLDAALATFADNPSSASAEVTKAASGFMSAYETRLISHVPGPVGVSLDFGTAVPLGGGLTLGAVLQNAPTIWPGQKITYASATGSATPAYKEIDREDENYTFSEPLGARVGLGWERATGWGGFGLSGDVGEALDGPATSNYFGTPSLGLGAYGQLASIVYGRVGTQIGGRSSLLGAGVGLNMGFARLDLAGSIEPDLGKVLESIPGSMRGVGVAVSFSLGV